MYVIFNSIVPLAVWQSNWTRTAEGFQPNITINRATKAYHITVLKCLSTKFLPFPMLDKVLKNPIVQTTVIETPLTPKRPDTVLVPGAHQKHTQRFRTTQKR